MLRFARSALFGLVCLVSLGVGITPSSAGDYPNRPVHWLVGFAAGGPVDIVARIMSQWLSDHLGQQFVVENRAGSGGNIAAAAAINSTPGVHTSSTTRLRRSTRLCRTIPRWSRSTTRKSAGSSRGS